MTNIITALRAGLSGAMFTRQFAQSSALTPSLKRSRTGEPSQYFGRRKMPVTAILKDGSKKRMALKNALKKKLDFTI